MTAYCNIGDVQKYISRIKLSGTSNPTAEQVDDIIEEVSTNIDAILAAKGYDTPITEEDALVYLRKWSAIGTAVEVMLSVASVGGGLPETYTELKEQYNQFLEDLKSGAAILPGISPPESVTGSYNEDMATGGDYEDPIFKIDDEY